MYENNLYLKPYNTGILNNSILPKCQQCCNFPVTHLLTIQFTKTITAILRSNTYMLSLLLASHALSYVHTISIWLGHYVTSNQFLNNLVSVFMHINFSNFYFWKCEWTDKKRTLTFYNYFAHEKSNSNQKYPYFLAITGIEPIGLFHHPSWLTKSES